MSQRAIQQTSKPANQQTDWALIGWQGITVKVPPDWIVGHVETDRKKGYLRFDDDEMPRLEIRWDTVPGAVEVEKVVKSYLDGIEKHAKKTKQSFKAQTDTKLLSRRQVKKRKVISFFWELVGRASSPEEAEGQEHVLKLSKDAPPTEMVERVGHGLVWKCPTCERVLIAQVLGKKGEPVKELAFQTLATLSDHSEKEHDVWSIYGLRFKMPKDWQLEAAQIQSYATELKFRRGEVEKLSVSRWALADVQLKGRSLVEWTEYALREHLKRFRIECVPVQINGHEGIELHGRPHESAQLARLFLRRLLKQDAPPVFAGCVWRCEQTNRLLLATSILKPANIEVVKEVVSSVQCHL